MLWCIWSLSESCKVTVSDTSTHDMTAPPVPKHGRMAHLSKPLWPPQAARSFSLARRCHPTSLWHLWPELHTPPGRCPSRNPLLRRRLNQGSRNWPPWGKKSRVQNGISPASVVFGQRMKTELGFYPNSRAHTQWHLVATAVLWFVGPSKSLREGWDEVHVVSLLMETEAVVLKYTVGPWCFFGFLIAVIHLVGSRAGRLYFHEGIFIVGCCWHICRTADIWMFPHIKNII